MKIQKWLTVTANYELYRKAATFPKLLFCDIESHQLANTFIALTSHGLDWLINEIVTIIFDEEGKQSPLDQSSLPCIFVQT